MVSSGLAPYKSPRALDSLLIYQQPSSTTLYYSYLRASALIEIRLRNETGKLHMYQCLSQSNSPSFLRLQHPSRMHRVGIAQEEPRHNIGLNCIRIDLRICWMLDRLATHKTPLAIASLLLYQQPSSTTLYYSYLGILASTEVKPRNETRGITGNNLPCASKGVFRPSSASVIS